MPYMVCLACELTSYSVGRITQDPCPRCDAPLTGGGSRRAPRRWDLAALRAAARRKGVKHGAR
jgi:hypothetical protein